MNENMKLLLIIAALALYKSKGATYALAYMIRSGIGHDESLDILATYDRYEEAIKLGKFP